MRYILRIDYHTWLLLPECSSQEAGAVLGLVSGAIKVEENTSEDGGKEYMPAKDSQVELRVLGIQPEQLLAGEEAASSKLRKIEKELAVKKDEWYKEYQQTRQLKKQLAEQQAALDALKAVCPHPAAEAANKEV